jgi:ferric-dicitrate binding protein FerR (iron transport regulator)
MKSRDTAERALSRVIAEARNESAPELDWARVEARIDAQTARSEPEVSRSTNFRPMLVLAAAGLALAVGWFAAGGRVPIAAPALPEARPSALDGNALAAGERIEAPAGDVAVEHAQHSQWTLEQGGRAKVTSDGGIVRVELEHGALVARVVPSPKAETFVVEAAGTRVAVRGTVFRVALTRDHVDVSVTEGTVLVGPRSEPGSGRPISANESSSFTLSGAPLSDERAARAPARRPLPDRRVLPSAERHRELAAQPSIDDVEKMVSQMLELGAGCFQSRTATANGVRVTASTLFTLRALPEGRVELIALDPPLAPPVQACVNEGIGKLSIAPSQGGIQITRRMELER